MKLTVHCISRADCIKIIYVYQGMIVVHSTENLADPRYGLVIARGLWCDEEVAENQFLIIR